MGNCQNFSDEDKSKSTGKTKVKVEQLMVRSMTWTRDSHGLFDYENKQIVQNNFKSMNAEEASAEEAEVIRVTQAEGVFWVNPTVEKNSKLASEMTANPGEAADAGVWLVLKSLRSTAYNKGYRLKEGDFVKLGRMRFRVKSLVVPDKAALSKKATKVEERKERRSIILEEQQSMKSVITCRICLCDETEEDNPFVSPCRCDGTMKHVHIMCLQKWLKSRVQTRDSATCMTVTWKTLDCELCKKNFPFLIWVNGRRYESIELPKPNWPTYVVLDIMSKERSQTKGVHVINLTGKTQVKLGRGHDSDVRVSDISVSRLHATITLDRGDFFIDDNDSKFGTLVLVRRAFPVLTETNNVMVQVGRSVLSFSSKTTRKISQVYTAAKDVVPDINFEAKHDPPAEEDEKQDARAELNIEQNLDNEVNFENFMHVGGDAFAQEPPPLEEDYLQPALEQPLPEPEENAPVP